MDNTTLKSLLHEYEQKRLKAEQVLEKNKNTLYDKYPRLREIEKEINLLSLNKVKLILALDNNKANEINSKIEELQDEKKNIMNKAHISENSFLPIYECSLCNDTGYINNGYKTIMCNCLKQKIFNIEYNKSNIGNVEYENFSSFSFDYYSDEVNPEKYGLPISPKENMKTIEKIAKSFIRNFNNPNEKNLLFTGNTRIGKNLSL